MLASLGAGVSCIWMLFVDPARLLQRTPPRSLLAFGSPSTHTMWLDVLVLSLEEVCD